jgi:hypothetical protein
MPFLRLACLFLKKGPSFWVKYEVEVEVKVVCYGADVKKLLSLRFELQ